MPGALEMRPGRRVSGMMIGALGLVNLLVVLASQFGVFQSSAQLKPDDVRPNIGPAFLVSLQGYEHDDLLLQSRLTEWSKGTNLVLYENGRPLGPSSHSVRTVRETGRGAYARVGPTLLFSSSDNTDARVNGRTYTLTYPLFVTRSVAWSVTALNAMLLLVWGWGMGEDGRRSLIMAARSTVSSVRSHRAFEPVVRGAMVVSFAGAIVFVNRAIWMTSQMLPCLFPDSGTYLRGAPMRTVGYPLFLQAALMASDDFRWIVPIQLNVLLGSFVVMAWAVGSLLESRLVMLIVGVSLFVTIPLLFNASNVISEAMFTAAICLHVAAVCRLLHTNSRLAGLVVGLTIGLAIVIRPAGYSFLVCLPVLLFLVRDHWRPVTGLVLGGLGIVLLTATMVQYQRFGFVGTQAIGGLSLVGHVAPVITEDLENDYPELTRRIARRLSPYVQDLQEPSPPLQHWRKTKESYNALLWDQIVPEIKAYLQEREPALAGAEREIRSNELAMAIARSAVRSRPVWYTRHFFAHYYGLWETFVLDRPAMEEYFVLCRHRSVTLLRDDPNEYLPFRLESYRWEDRNDTVNRDDGPDAWLEGAWGYVPYFTPVGVQVAFVVTVLAMVSLMVGCFGSRAVKMLAYQAVAIHASLVLIASVQAGIDRYTEPLLPILIVELVGGAVLLTRWAGTALCSSVLPQRQASDGRNLENR